MVQHLNDKTVDTRNEAALERTVLSTALLIMLRASCDESRRFTLFSKYSYILCIQRVLNNNNKKNPSCSKFKYNAENSEENKKQSDTLHLPLPFFLSFISFWMSVYHFISCHCSHSCCFLSVHFSLLYH